MTLMMYAESSLCPWLVYSTKLAQQVKSFNWLFPVKSKACPAAERGQSVLWSRKDVQSLPSAYLLLKQDVNTSTRGRSQYKDFATFNKPAIDILPQILSQKKVTDRGKQSRSVLEKLHSAALAAKGSQSRMHGFQILLFIGCSGGALQLWLRFW